MTTKMTPNKPTTGGTGGVSDNFGNNVPQPQHLESRLSTKRNNMTTIQTIKEAEDRFENKFCYPKGHIVAGLLKSGLDEEDIQSHITQTLLAVFENELANVPAEFSPLFPCEACETEDGENQCPNCFVMQGRNNIFAKQRSHLTEVINYLKQK